MANPILSESYLTTYVPPIPTLTIYISSPATDTWLGPLTAIVDSGADFCIVPLQLLKDIGANAERSAIIASQWDDRISVKIYVVDIRIGTSTLPGVEVAGDPTTNEIILGRNLLNYLDIELNGPQLELRLLNI